MTPSACPEEVPPMEGTVGSPYRGGPKKTESLNPAAAARPTGPENLDAEVDGDVDEVVVVVVVVVAT